MDRRLPASPLGDSPCSPGLGHCTEDTPIHLLLSGGLLARSSGVGPLLFSARSMAIWMSSIHFSISDLELGTEMTLACQIMASQRQAVRGQVQELPGSHDDGLPLAPQGQAVGHTPLLFTLLDLWKESLPSHCRAARQAPGAFVDTWEPATTPVRQNSERDSGPRGAVSIVREDPLRQNSERPRDTLH